jgi:hypothetical protein
MSTPSPLAYVYDGRRCLGHSKAGFEAFDRDHKSLGCFPSMKQAANACSLAELSP